MYDYLAMLVCAISIHFRQDQEYQESLQKDQQRSSLRAARRRAAQELPKEATAPRKAFGDGGEWWRSMGYWVIYAANGCQHALGC